MVTFKHVKTNRSAEVKGTPPSTVGKLNRENGKPSRHVQEAGGRGKPAVGTLSNQVAKVAANLGAKGQSRDGGPTTRNGARNNPEASRARGTANLPSAFTAGNTRVTASGGSPGRGAPKIDKAPTYFSQRAKVALAAPAKPAATNGYSGSSEPGQARIAGGQTGSGLGKRKKT